MRTGQSAEDDHVIQREAPAQLLNAARAEIVFIFFLCGVGSGKVNYVKRKSDKTLECRVKFTAYPSCYMTLTHNC